MAPSVDSTPIIEVDNVSVFYGDKKAVNEASFPIRDRGVCALIGPSGCGKSTLLRSLNRMNDQIDVFRLSGTVRYHGKDIYSDEVDPVHIRKRIGMVFQKPTPFPTSIYKNISWAPQLHGYIGDHDELVELCLRKAALWDEVKDRLHESGLSLSGGQQQRLCIARTIAMSPEVILMDEPCASLDPGSTERIEALIAELKDMYSIVIVTHSMAQARRVSDDTAFMYQGDLAEFGPTADVFASPQNQLTKDYVSGRFG